MYSTVDQKYKNKFAHFKHIKNLVSKDEEKR